MQKCAYMEVIISRCINNKRVVETQLDNSNITAFGKVSFKVHMFGMITYPTVLVCFSSVSASFKQWATIAALHHATGGNTTSFYV